MRPMPILLAAVIAATALPAGAASLADFTGEWRGTGRFQRETRDSQRKGRLTCRLVIEAESTNVIVVNGRCAAPEGSRGFVTRITDAGGGVLSGKALKGTGARSGRTSAGTLNANGLHLEGRDALGAFMFALGAPKQGRMEMRSSAQDGNDSDAAQVTLRRVD